MKTKLVTISFMFLSAMSLVFGYESWDAGKTYPTAGSLVEHNGKVWKNSWWTKGENPELSGQWGVWKKVEGSVIPDPVVNPVPPAIGTWDKSVVYNGGDIVAHNGKSYKAGWWTRGENPELSGQWDVWKVIEGTAGPAPVIDPTPDPDPIVDPDPVIEPTPDPVIPVSSEKNIGGYFAEWGIYGRNYQVTDLPVKYLTHINYAFLNIENGIPVLGDPWAAVEKRYPEVVTEYGVYPAHSWEGTKPYYGNIARLNKLDELVNSYYGKDIKILFSVGGWTWSENFPEMVATYESRANFLTELVRMIKLYKFEGVSYDWEYPVIGPQFAYIEPIIEEAEQFKNLIRETRLAFDELSAETGIQYEITIAMSANPVNLEYLDLTALAAYADNFDVMTYDYAAVAWGSGAQHQSPLFDNPDNPNPDYHDFNVNNICQYLISQGVDSKRIMVGCPAYGRSGTEVLGLFQPGGIIGPGTWEKGNLDYDSIMGRSSKFNVDTNPDNYKWDDKAKASYYLSDDGTFISYDSPRAIKEKCKYIKEQDLGGLFIWEFSNDRNNDILKTAAETLNTDTVSSNSDI